MYKINKANYNVAPIPGSQTDVFPSKPAPQNLLADSWNLCCSDCPGVCHTLRLRVWLPVHRTNFAGEPPLKSFSNPASYADSLCANAFKSADSHCRINQSSNSRQSIHCGDGINRDATGWLSDRNRRYEEAIARHKAQLQAQTQLASIREDFVSTLTHDLKTPLLGAIETIKLFQAGQFGTITPPQEKVLRMMDRSHHASLQLIQTLLDVYRNDAEGLQLQRQPVNLVALAEEVIATFTNLAASRRVHILLNHGESDFRRSLWVNGDALQLQRVFANLLVNAINHSPRGGKVEVRVASPGEYQIVRMLDSGQGITEEELPHLFERFYQGHTNRQATGSGLGLYLTRQIIEAHGGTIWAENRKPKGALFGFKLPAYVKYK